MLKKILFIGLPFMLIACGMEYEGELISYSALEDEAGIESMPGSDLSGERAQEVGQADFEDEINEVEERAITPPPPPKDQCAPATYIGLCLAGHCCFTCGGNCDDSNTQECKWDDQAKPGKRVKLNAGETCDDAKAKVADHCKCLDCEDAGQK